jgi:flagellar biosynthetic protein FliR
MELISLSPEQFKSFILVLTRISIVLFMLPIFGTAMLPNLVKAGMALTISFALFTVVRPDPNLFPESLLSSLNLIVSEVIFGLVIGLTIRLFFAAIQLGGQLIGFQMGFAISNVLDPESGAQTPIVAHMGYWIAVLIFLLLNGHHILLKTLADSFSVVEVGSFGFRDGLFHKILDVSGDMFSIAIKFGAPTIAALLFTSAAFGIVAKLVPQMNILIVAFPLKIVVGLFFFGLSLRVLLYLVEQYVGGLGSMLKVMVGPMGV